MQKRYAKRKDEELVKMSIGARRDMDEKMKIERNTLKEVLTNQSKRDLEAAVDRKKLVRHFKDMSILLGIKTVNILAIKYIVI